MARDDLVLPRKINADNPETFGRTAEEHSGDTFNMLLKVKARLNGLRADLDALETTVGAMGFAPPVRGVGGGNLEGVSPLGARADHDHALRETAGPTDLSIGAWLNGETPRRVGPLILGRQVEARQLTAPVSRTNTALLNVGLSFPLKAATDYLVYWFIIYQTALTTTGIILSQASTGTLTSIQSGLLGATGAAAMQSAATNVNDGPLGTAGVGPGPTDRVAVLYGSVRALTAGTLNLRFASGVSGSGVTIQAGSHGFLVQQ